MSAPFIHEDFLLETNVARHVYHAHVRDLPIVDYHCHLPVESIASNHVFRSITEIWLDGDHYKWRAMRANGVDEKFCTGQASDWEKFHAWAATVPLTIRNPLFHWTAMELKRPFEVDDLLDETSARRIFDTCNEKLAKPSFSTQGLLEQFKVAVVCTTDDPTDSLESHRMLASRPKPATRVYPTFRPDKALAVDDPVAWTVWIDALRARSGVNVSSFDTLLEALEKRHTAFHDVGCRASDHGLERMDATPWAKAGVSASVDGLLRGRPIDAAAQSALRSALLHELARLDHRRGWVQQFHLGAMRNNNTRMRRTLGADAGFDSVGDFDQARGLARFLDALDEKDALAKTILYNLNPADNEVFATMLGNFQDGSTPGKMQWGSAWWFLDQLDGMEKQLSALSNMGLFSRFIGMVTDSRSFLSYSRHDYFRRLVCNMLGRDVARGFIPNDEMLLARAAKAIAFTNARDYLGLPLGTAANS
jgi:glucuronate isomerase